MNTQFDKNKILEESKNLNRDYIDVIASRSMSLKEFSSKMEFKYNYLFKNFKSIFDMAITNKFDYRRLSIMVDMASKVQKNEITEHEASVHIGQILVDDIVKPQLDKGDKGS